MDFVRKTLPDQHYLYVDRECEYGPGIAEAMGSGFAEVFGFVGSQGITPVSMPMSVYLGMDPKILRFRSAVMVSPQDAEKAEGSIKADILSSGDVMTVTHVGSYDNMNKTHEAMWDHMKAEGIPGSMPVWEIYIDDPGDTAPEKLRTEIYCAIGTG